FVPAGAYRNRDYAGASVTVKTELSRAMQDIFFDPQTSGGLLMAVAEKDAEACLRELKDSIPVAERIGYVTELKENYIVIE
ncbi:MAG: selenide, water dikinase SelD, partial [Oscillospiraceae bacterium]|nr:selenide, water dikinase SelD [Oscillospiraceae bacterium]